MLNLLDVLTVHNVYRFQILKFTYLWHKGLLLRPFSNYFQYASNVHKYNTSYASKQNYGKTDNRICCMCYLEQNSLKSQRTKHIPILKTTENLFTVVQFSFFDILKTFSFFLRREMTCFAVVWTTWAYDDKCSILSSLVPSLGSNLIPG